MKKIVDKYEIFILDVYKRQVVTIAGTLLGLIIMTMYAYALSRKNFAYRKFFTKLIFIPMLFSGGMVASYLVMVNFLHLKDNILALILDVYKRQYQYSKEAL